MSAFCQPPTKKQKISPSKSIARGSHTQQPPTTKATNQKPDTQPTTDDDDDTEESPYHYALHINPDIIIHSTDPTLPANRAWWDIEHDASVQPNLFIVQKSASAYCAEKWLDHHSTKTDDIARAAALLSNASVPLLIVTGAGMGCDSNLPDYRSAGGFWNDYAPLRRNKLSLHEMSTTCWFQSDARSAWGFYAHRARLYRDAQPHEGFRVLLDIAAEGCHYDARPRDYQFMTSNIDGQALKAGFDANRIFQTHGALSHLQCLALCDDAPIVDFGDGYDQLLDDEVDAETLRAKSVEALPRCAQCGGLMRPNVSFFSDTADTFDDERTAAQKERFLKWLRPFTVENAKKKLLVVEIGAGKSVHSLRWESEHLSELANVTLIRINPVDDVDESAPHSRHITLKLGAKMALVAIEKEMKKLKKKKKGKTC